MRAKRTHYQDLPLEGDGPERRDLVGQRPRVVARARGRVRTCELHGVHSEEAAHERQWQLVCLLAETLREKDILVGVPYEEYRHDSEDHDGLALAHRLLALLHGLVGLNHAGLLLLQAEEVVYLDHSQYG